MEKDAIGKYDIVVIGGSAGSLEVVIKMVGVFQDRANISYIIVLHRKNSGNSLLENLLASKTGIMVKEVEDKDPILINTIYIAPADYPS